MSRILAIGIATLDIVNLVPEYLTSSLRGSLDQALTGACRLAGRSCGLVGLTEVGNG